MKEFMVRKRETLGLSRQTMAEKCQCSEGLLCMLELSDRDITHPNIAARIAREYGLDVDEYNLLVHEEHFAKKLPKATKRKATDGLYVPSTIWDKWRRNNNDD